MRLNLDLLRTQAADIRRELAALRRYAALPEEAFTADPEKVRAARYGLIVVVEAAMARLRNLLVHAYARVDDRKVHHILREDLEDLEAFLEAVAAFVHATGETL